MHTSLEGIPDDRHKLTIIDRINHPSVESIECVGLLHHWLKSGVIDGIDVKSIVVNDLQDMIGEDDLIRGLDSFLE